MTHPDTRTAQTATDVTPGTTPTSFAYVMSPEPCALQWWTTTLAEDRLSGAADEQVVRRLCAARPKLKGSSARLREQMAQVGTNVRSEIRRRMEAHLIAAAKTQGVQVSRALITPPPGLDREVLTIASDQRWSGWKLWHPGRTRAAAQWSVLTCSRAPEMRLRWGDLTPWSGNADPAWEEMLIKEAYLLRGNVDIAEQQARLTLSVLERAEPLISAQVGEAVKLACQDQASPDWSSPPDAGSPGKPSPARRSDCAIFVIQPRAAAQHPGGGGET